MPFSNRSERVSCDHCGVIMCRSNLSRHHARQHGTRRPSDSTSRDSGVADDTSVLSEQDFSAPRPGDVSQAVLSLLEQHDKYTQPDLCRYLKEEFREIPPEFHAVIVAAATTAAQYVAATHNLFEANRESPDSKKGPTRLKPAVFSRFGPWVRALFRVVRSVPLTHLATQFPECSPPSS